MKQQQQRQQRAARAIERAAVREEDERRVDDARECDACARAVASVSAAPSGGERAP